MTLGWVKPVTGPSAIPGQIEGALTLRLPGVLVVADRPRRSVSARSDRMAVARFSVAPGRYHVRLADDHNCGAGANPATIEVPVHGTVYAQVTCEQP